MNGTWVEIDVRVADRPVRLSVERLDEPALERTAATLAWLFLGTLRSGTRDEVSAWNDRVAAMVSEHVTFVVPGATPPNQLGSDWWNEAVGTAFLQFVRANQLAPRINRHLDMLRTFDSSTPTES